MSATELITDLLENQESSAFKNNIDLFKKIVLTAYIGRLRINNQAPDDSVCMGDYLLDQENMIFDFSRLSEKTKKSFMSWLVNNHMQDKRSAFLSRVSTSEYRGFTAEVFLSWWGRLKAWLFVRKSHYWALNEIELKLEHQLSGIEFCYGNKGILVSFNQVLTPEDSSKYRNPHDKQKSKCGNTKRVFLTDHLVDILTKTDISSFDFVDIIKKKHPQAIKVKDYDYRYNKMLEHRKIQKFIRLKPWYRRLFEWFIHLFKKQKEVKTPVQRGEWQEIIATDDEDVQIFQRRGSEHVLVTEKFPDINILVFSGGGGKIFGHVGVVKALQECGIKPKKFVGTSAGAIMSLLCYLGYTAEEIHGFFRSINRDNLVYTDADLSGLSDATALKTHLDYMIINKIQEMAKRYNLSVPEKITFKVLEEFRIRCPESGFGEMLKVAVTNKSKGELRYFSLEDTPDEEVSLSVTASACVPVLYRPLFINGEAYSDGGILNNLPTEGYPDNYSKLLESEYGTNPEALVIQFDNGTERDALDKIVDKVYRENFILNWIFKLLTGVNDPASAWEQDRWKLRHHALQTVIVPVGKLSSTNFSVSEEDQNQLISNGYDAMLEYLYSRYQGLTKAKPGEVRRIFSFNDMQIESEFTKVEGLDLANQQLMYSTFHSLGELLSYCCYRGNKIWFEKICIYISQAALPDKNELLSFAKDLSSIYFNENISDAKPAVSAFFESKKLHERNRIFQAIYLGIQGVSCDLFASEQDFKHFRGGRHHFKLDNPYACLPYFKRISDKKHIVIAAIIAIITNLPDRLDERVIHLLTKMSALLREKDWLKRPEFMGDWRHLHMREFIRVLEMMHKNLWDDASALCDMYKKNMEPMEVYNVSEELENELLDCIL